MAVITIEYDARNTIIKKMIGIIVDLGATVENTTTKKEKVTTTGHNVTLAAMEELKQGKGIQCNSFAEYKRKMR